MKLVAVVFVTLMGGFIGNAARADDITLETAPPVVVKTVPEAGAGEVDAKLTEIKVTFSKNMHRRGRNGVTPPDVASSPSQ